MHGYCLIIRNNIILILQLQLDSIESSCNEYTEQDYKMLGGEKEIK
jgi:hypothetical protein